MNKQQVIHAGRKFLKGVEKHSPTILMVVGITGMITSTVFAVKVTPKALRQIDEREADENRKLTTVEVVQTTWKYYIPAVATGALSIACLIGAGSISFRRNAALAAACTLSETALKEYQEKALAVVGEKKEQEIRDAIARDQLKAHPLTNTDGIVLEEGEYWCFDPLSGRYFKSTQKILTDAELELNRQMRDEMTITINDFYDAIHRDRVDRSVGDELGWDIDRNGYIKLNLYWEKYGTPEGKPCIVVGHYNPPIYLRNGR